MKREEIELLAPAGSYEGFEAAIGAGADAVYVGGAAFGARAYAKNFGEEELLRAIDTAHIHGRKLYLTVNTLLKNRELSEQLYDYLLPYYKEGLDAVIVQDMGVFKMIREMMPDAKKIGILYTTSEANSCSTIEEYKELADKYDFEIVDTGINTSADIEIAASDLVSKVDCLCNLTDNTVVNALQTVLDKANGAKIPVFGSEIEQVKSGCVASMGIDYYQLGIKTGKMAAKILKGEEKASDTPFITASKAELYVNTAAADKIGMTLDADYIKDAAETFDKIEVK